MGESVSGGELVSSGGWGESSQPHVPPGQSMKIAMNIITIRQLYIKHTCFGLLISSRIHSNSCFEQDMRAFTATDGLGLSNRQFVEKFLANSVLSVCPALTRKLTKKLF